MQFSLAQVDAPRLIDAQHSPVGLSRYREALVSVLTSDRRVAVYAPPKKAGEPWNLKHNVTQGAKSHAQSTPDNDGCSATSLKSFRVTSMAWTCPIPCLQPIQGKTYLVTGDETGQIHFHDISESAQAQLRVFKCSDFAITKICPGHWSGEGFLHLIISDAHGTIKFIYLSTSVQNGIVFLAEKPGIIDLSHEKTSRCTNMRIHYSSYGTVLIAVTYPGRLCVLQYDLQTTDLKKAMYALPFISSVTGLCWTEPDSTGARLFVFGYCGHTLVLALNRTTFTLSEDTELIDTVKEYMQEALSDPALVHEDIREEWQVRIHGATISPDSLFLTLSYQRVPVNCIRYQIAATLSSTVATICIVKDTTPYLARALDEFYMNPYVTSSSYVCGLHKKLGISILKSLDSPDLRDTPMVVEPMEVDLRGQLYLSRPINTDRLAIASGELQEQDLVSTTRRLQESLMTSILRFGSVSELVPQSVGQKLLLRFADWVVLYANGNAELVGLAKVVYSSMQDRGLALGEIVNTYMDQGTISADQWPSRDICPICESPVLLKESLLIGECTKGHRWHRCSLTLAIIDHEVCRTCLACGKKAVMDRDTRSGDVVQDKILEVCEICFYCGSNWSCKYGT